MKLFYTLLFLLFTVCILTHSELSLAYALLGLNLWFDKMIPSLLPFMMLSGIMIRMNLSKNFSKLLYPVIRPLFKISENGCYALIIGFLCGFPMGAKTVADLLKRNMISAKEAAFLLSFCNNIGPVYFCSFVLPLLGRKRILPYVFGMYGLPLLYGLFLRHIRYAEIPFESTSVSHAPYESMSVHIAQHSALTHTGDSKRNNFQLLNEIDDAITSSVQSILSLGGYMILFSLLNLPFHILLGKTPTILAPIFEITGGLKLSGGQLPLYALLLLPFGGLSCIAQTYSCIKGTGLSIAEYTLHKIILTVLTALYYLSWHCLSPNTFLY